MNSAGRFYTSSTTASNPRNLGRRDRRQFGPGPQLRQRLPKPHLSRLRPLLRPISRNPGKMTAKDHETGDSESSRALVARCVCVAQGDKDYLPAPSSARQFNTVVSLPLAKNQPRFRVDTSFIPGRFGSTPAGKNRRKSLPGVGRSN